MKLKLNFYRTPTLFCIKIKADLAEPFTENNTETDCFYENPHLPLADNSVSMCVREMVPSGIKLWIVKGLELLNAKPLILMTAAMYKTC